MRLSAIQRGRGAEESSHDKYYLEIYLYNSLEYEMIDIHQFWKLVGGRARADKNHL